MQDGHGRMILMLKKISNMSISKQLIICLILACILPLSFLGLMSYNNSKSILTKEIDSSSAQMMEGKKNIWRLFWVKSMH